MQSIESQREIWIRIFLHFLSISSAISGLEYVSSIIIALVGNYCSRTQVGRTWTMSNQRKKRIEKSRIKAASSEKLQLLAHMPKVISTYRRCA
jgi:hypothetical protein